MSGSKTFPLRLPDSLKAALEKRAREDGTSLNQFVSIAVAEKLSAMDVESYFAERREKANFDEFDRIMRRTTGEPPREGDEIPESIQDMTRALADTKNS